MTPQSPVDLIRRGAIRIGEGDTYDALVDAVGDARVVLIGESTHGTHEFYAERAAITRQLIDRKGFAAVAVEADWPDAYRVDRFVRGRGADRDAVGALGDFRRFPTWMWRNTVVRDFVDRLRRRNDAVPAPERAGFYGLDLYSLHASMQKVIEYLDVADPQSALTARARYACFDRFGEDPERYALAAGQGYSATCEREVVSQLVDMRRRAAELASRDGRLAEDDYFFAEQNARLVANAEEYYRTMIGGRIESWNIRDRHMADTIEALLGFLERDRPGAKLVVWAHNSHVGDARATQMGREGEWTVGQLAREGLGADAVLVGLTTYEGAVTAASEWNRPPEHKTVRPALAGSVEHLFHETGLERFVLPLRRDADVSELLSAERLERAIGVLYLPHSERRSHYFHARLSEQFDFILHIDRTTAVQPLDRGGKWHSDEVGDTFPTGL
jgi:erythromycin esterase-like protein